MGVGRWLSDHFFLAIVDIDATGGGARLAARKVEVRSSGVLLGAHGSYAIDAIGVAKWKVRTRLEPSASVACTSMSNRLGVDAVGSTVSV